MTSIDYRLLLKAFEKHVLKLIQSLAIDVAEFVTNFVTYIRTWYYIMIIV